MLSLNREIIVLGVVCVTALIFGGIPAFAGDGDGQGRTGETAVTCPCETCPPAKSLSGGGGGTDDEEQSGASKAAIADDEKKK